MHSFEKAYDVLLERWGVEIDVIEVSSRFGTTRVNACAPRDAPPLVLLQGGRSSSPSWYANAAVLARNRRVYALDTIGDPGHSRNTGAPMRTREDLLDWLTHVLAALGIERVDLCGHSFGAWLALTYALQAPHGGIGRLALLDPTQCFAGFAPACLWHAAPTMLRPSRGDETYLRWETRGAELDPDWHELHRLGATVPVGKIIPGRRPKAAALQALDVPVLVLLAENSRVHDIARVAERASRTLPHAVIDTLPEVSHHMIPFTRPETLNEKLTAFFAAAD